MNEMSQEKLIEERIKAALEGGKLPCAAAFKIAAELNLPPRRIGEAADALGIKISSCQLGCFP